MPDLLNLLNIAVGNKPKMGAPCNHCGYCCLSEICPTGKTITKKEYGPCPLLINEEGSNKHYCQLVTSGGKNTKEDLGIGYGCCAETQKEAILRITNNQ